MNRIQTFLLCILVLITYESALGQKSIFHISIQGTWDKEKQRDRAQFGGDNRLINTYFSSYDKEFLRFGPDAIGIGSISFRVNKQGTVDSLVINEKAGSTWDSTFYYALKAMSGKWRAGEVNGKKRNEIITIWYNIYNGPKFKKTPTEYVEIARKYAEDAAYEKALKNIDLALAYDGLSIEAIILKAKSLYYLNQKEKSCNLIKSSIKYKDEKLTKAAIEFCN